MSKNSLSIVIPAYNEEKNLAVSLDEAIKAANESNLDYEIIIIDDCSSDNTWKVALELCNVYPGVRAYQNEINKGLGGTYKRGLELSTKDYISWIPADHSHDANSLSDAYESIGMADIIIPVPRNPEVRATVRQIISRVFTYTVNKISPTNIPYYNGLSVHKVSLLRNITIQTDSFGFQAEIIVRLLRAGATYKVVGTTISERKTGSSKAFTIKNILEVVKILGVLKSN